MSSIDYFGSIIGVCASNIYKNNSYSLNDGISYYNFDGNYYLDNSSNAFGATVKDGGEYSLVEDKGATSATLEVIQNSEVYNSILKKLN